MRRFACWAWMLFVVGFAGCRLGGTVENSDEPHPGPVAAHADNTFQPPSPPEGWERAGAPRRFVGADLFNHIDGAAEVFLELGFRQVLVQTYGRNEATLDLQVYEMENATAARALFLRFRGKGVAAPGVAGRNVGNRYQITAQQSRFFAQLNNPAGDGGNVPAIVDLANRTLRSLPEDEEVSLLAVLPEAGQLAGSEVIFRGPYTLQSICTLGEGDILQMSGQVYGVAAVYETESDGRFTRLIIPYSDVKATRAAFANLRDHLDPELRAVRQDERSIVFQDYRGEFGNAAIRTNVIEIHVGLPREPGSK